MGRLSTLPNLFDNALQLKIHRLKEWGYIQEGNHQKGVVHWLKNDVEIASISIQVHIFPQSPYIELAYKFGNEARKYRVYLTWTTSNLTGGKVWYFVCPKTNKRCRKLYSIDGYFLHRDSFTGAMYYSQTLSKNNRLMEKAVFPFLNSDLLYNELNKKYFKKTYAGKPTKKYLRLLEKNQRAESIPYFMFERLITKVK